jgi:nucleoside-diphosphate-sugar epimerase
MILVTGSAGHLGEGLMRTLRASGRDAIGIDLKPSAFTTIVGSIADRGFVKRCIAGVDAVIHAATLHKPHIVTHGMQAFVDTNVTGTLNLLEEAIAARVRGFVFTSSTSVFGRASTPAPGAPAAWITEDVQPIPKNVYGITKLAAEHLCELFHRTRGLPAVVLRTSRFFPEQDDRRATRDAYEDGNAKANEFLYRRADLEDVVGAHLLAVEKARGLGFARYIVSATTPFTREDLHDLGADAHRAVARRVPAYLDVYERRKWSMFPQIDRVYVNDGRRASILRA